MTNHGPTEPKKRGRPFLKGHSIRNPKLPDELKQASKLTRAEAKAKLVNCLQMNLEDLQALVKNPETKAIDIWVARVVLMGIQGGDEKRLAWMFDRLFGKLDDTTKEVNLNLHQMPNRQVIEIGEAAIKYLKETEDESGSPSISIEAGDGSDS